MMNWLGPKETPYAMSRGFLYEVWQNDHNALWCATVNEKPIGEYPSINAAKRACKLRHDMLPIQNNRSKSYDVGNPKRERNLGQQHAAVAVSVSRA